MSDSYESFIIQRRRTTLPYNHPDSWYNVSPILDRVSALELAERLLDDFPDGEFRVIRIALGSNASPLKG